MESSREKTATIGKGYSYLFAIALTFFVALQSIEASFSSEGDAVKIKIATREVNTQIFFPCVALIATILGVNTDSIALAFGQFLSPSPKSEKEP